MKKSLQQVLIMTAVTGSLSSIAFAQTKCPGGQAANGECVNEVLAISAIQAVVIFSQPKISLTAYPVLPSLDRIYRYPNQLNPNPLLPTRVGTRPPPPPVIVPPPSGGGGGGGGDGGGGPIGN